jgi:hypothetical protein
LKKNFNLIWIVILMPPPLKLLIQSLGLLATEILLKKPNLFDHYKLYKLAGSNKNAAY